MKLVRTIERWARLGRDLGLLFGVPVLIVVGMHLYDMEAASLKARSEALEAQNRFLKETQFDRTSDLLEGQKKTYEFERQDLLKQLDKSKQEGSANAEEANRLQARLAKISENIQALDTSRSFLQSVFPKATNFRASTFESFANFSQSSFRDEVSFADVHFKSAVDFHRATFGGAVEFPKSSFRAGVSFVDVRFESSVIFAQSIFGDSVSFEGASFKSHVIFDGADLRGGSFKHSDLRGVDLSEAVVDANTKLPKP